MTRDTDLIRRGDAPDRIWIEEDDGCPYFYDASELAEAGGPLIEYIRADLAHPVQEPPSPGVTAGATGVDDDPPCTDCGGTGITYQTERRCACQGPVEAWLIHKAGRGWYRPDAQGYTGNPAKAGRYSYEDAYRHSRPNGETGPRDGITIKRASEVLATPAPVVPAEGLADYDAGLLNDFGGGNVEWWQDYLRAEIGRANDFWRDQVSALRSAPHVGARMTDWQPIDTAPKDGVTEVLMYDPDLGMAVWPSANSPWPNVTHWMPLPEPPEAPHD